MIFIRADANETIGTGHIMRCLAIAEKIRALCQDVTFIVADNRSRPMIENRGFKTICLGMILIARRKSLSVSFKRTVQISYS